MFKFTKKNLIRIVCAMIIAVVSLTGCGGGSNSNAPTNTPTKAPTPTSAPANTNTNESPEAEPAVVEVFGIEWMAGHDTTEALADDPAILFLNDTFNVKINPWYLARENYEELLTLRITGGEIPDVFMLPNAASFATYVKQGILLEMPITDIQQIMPNTYKWIMEFEPKAFDVVSFKGMNYGLPRINVDGQYNYAPYWRRDWLEAAGFAADQVPMTLDEFERAFYYFRNDDPDGNGQKDTYALSNTGMNPIFGAFGALPDRWIDDGNGNLIYGAVYGGMKDALTLLAKWYGDGLIDPEFITGENQGGYWANSVPFENGQIGFSSSGAYYHIMPAFERPDGSMTSVGRTLRSFAEKTGYDKVIIGYNPPGPDGKQGGEKWRVADGDCIVFSYTLSNQPEKLKRIMEVLEGINSDYDNVWKIIWLWDVNTDAYYYDELFGYMPKDPDYVGPSDSHTNLFNSLQNPYFTARANPLNYVWASGFPQFKAGGYENLLKITTDSNPNYWSALDTFRQASYMQIIRGEQPVDYFDSFVSQWNNMGGEVITREANEWYHSK